MHTFAQRLFLMFGLRRHTAAHRTPATLQVDRCDCERDKVVPLRPHRSGPQGRPSFRIGIEIRGQGEQYVKIIPAVPRNA